MEIELPTVKEIDKSEENEFLDIVNRLVVTRFQEEKNKEEESILVSVDDIRNAARIEEKISKDYIKLMREHFENNRYTVNFDYIDGESGKKYFQFTMPPKKTV